MQPGMDSKPSAKSRRKGTTVRFRQRKATAMISLDTLKEALTEVTIHGGLQPYWKVGNNGYSNPLDAVDAIIDKLQPVYTYLEQPVAWGNWDYTNHRLVGLSEKKVDNWTNAFPLYRHLTQKNFWHITA